VTADVSREPVSREVLLLKLSLLLKLITKQPGPANCYDTYLIPTRAKIPFAALRGDPAPLKGDEGFLYLVLNYTVDENKYGSFKVTDVIYRAASPTHLMYTLIVNKIGAKSATSPRPKPPAPPLGPAAAQFLERTACPLLVAGCPGARSDVTVGCARSLFPSTTALKAMSSRPVHRDHCRQ
jgi:hypothetical protein